MRRRHSPAEVAIRRRWRKVWDALNAWRDADPPVLSRKRHPLDCGNARCGICHGHKLKRIPTRQERNAEQRLREADGH